MRAGRLAAVAACAVIATHGDARATVTRSCRWNIPSVPVYVDLATFDVRGWDQELAIQQVVNALTPWNTEGGGGLRAYYAGNKAYNNVGPSEVIVGFFDSPQTVSTCALAITAFTTPSCGPAAIAVYDRTNENCSDTAHPLEWRPDAPEVREFSLTEVLVHELGHALGGYSDDYTNPNTVMQAAPQGSAPSLHLYNTDMDLFQNGSGPITGYGVSGRPVHFMYSSDTVSWTDDPTNLGTTSLRPTAASAQSAKVVAFVDTLNPGSIVRTRKFTTAGGWEPPVAHESSRVGPALGQGLGTFVLVYPASDDARRLRVQTSIDGKTWTSPVNLHNSARSQSAASVFFNSQARRFFVFWTDRDDDRVRYSVSSDAITWSAPREFDGSNTSDPRVFYAFNGPAGSCDASNHCLVVWPTWNTFGPSNLPICTMQTAYDVTADHFTNMNLRCTDATARTPGVAFGANGGTAAWVMGFAGRDTNTSLVISHKVMHSTSEDWGSRITPSWSNQDGVDMMFNQLQARWEVYLATR
jgi:hypothetical protein